MTTPSTGATTLLTVAAAKMGMTPKVAAHHLTILDLPGKKRVPTKQLEDFLFFVAVEAEGQPWRRAVPLDAQIEITESKSRRRKGAK